MRSLKMCWHWLRLAKTVGIHHQHSLPTLVGLNAAARLTYHLCRSDHTTDALVCLHWLCVPERVQFKISVLTYNVLHGRATQYLGPLNRVADLPGRRSLHSTNSNRMVVPSVRLSTVANRAFPVVGPRCTRWYIYLI